MWRSRFATRQVARWSPCTSLSTNLRTISVHDPRWSVQSYSGSVLGFFVRLFPGKAVTAFYAPSIEAAWPLWLPRITIDSRLYRDSKLSTWRSTVTVVSARNVKSPQNTKFSESTVAAGQTSRLVHRCSASKNCDMHYHVNTELS